MAEWDDDDWKADCLRTHGRELTGERGHWCPDWDWMPVDETCKEFEACTCVGIGAGSSKQAEPS